MESALAVSNLILWIVIIVLGVTVLALARQVGVLFERIAPAGALMIGAGPGVGAAAGAGSRQKHDFQGFFIYFGCDF